MKTETLDVNPDAGKKPASSALVDVSALIAAYHSIVPDPTVAEQRVAFGTSGHRGCALRGGFNEWHILATSQAICDYRQGRRISGPLFLGIDTHALSGPAMATALEVLAANGVEVVIAEGDEFTPTPVISHAILAHNRGRDHGLADGIVVTPSHNPPQDGGFKYNPPNGGPADTQVTAWVETRANAYIEARLQGVKRIPLEQALRAPSTHRRDFLHAYVEDLGTVIDMEAIRAARISLGVDPLGGAGVHYWPAIAERYRLNLTVVNESVDPTFRFMNLDWDGQIRMDPSSPYVMSALVGYKDRFDVAFACDTDHDRHGIVTRSAGLLPSNHYLAAAIAFLFRHRPRWRSDAAVGKTVVSSRMIDCVASKLGRRLYEVPVGFKWFVDGLLDGSLGFAGEESAGASFLRIDGSVWTTDKDGITAALLAAEITATAGHDPGALYAELAEEFGDFAYDRMDTRATAAQMRQLRTLTPRQLQCASLAGDPVTAVLSNAPGNAASIGGVKCVTDAGWIAVRPSGTENVYKIYAESMRGADHLRRLQAETQALVTGLLSDRTEVAAVSEHKTAGR